MFTVRCPKCKHDQLYKPRSDYVPGKSKTCVYCGRSFTVHSNIMKSRIVCEGKRDDFNMPLMPTSQEDFTAATK